VASTAASLDGFRRSRTIEIQGCSAFIFSSAYGTAAIIKQLLPASYSSFGLKKLPVNRHVQTGNSQSNSAPVKKKLLAVEARFERLESIVGQIGEAVLATTETIERLADRVDALTVQMQHQGHQVQQQSYQVFALGDAVQTLAEAQNESLEQLGQLTQTLQHLAIAIEASEPQSSSQTRRSQ
jgi:methyl-accepting chemotaxis protein